MIEINNLTLNQILTIPSLKINRGDFICITGESGAGKTTLLNILFGLIKPTSGRIIIQHNAIGYSPQEVSYLPYLTVKEHILISIKNERRVKVAEETLVQFGIYHKIDNFFSTLSGGQKRICNLAIAIANGENLLLLDEPFNDLDKNKINTLISILKAINNTGVTIVITTHHYTEDLEPITKLKIATGHLIK